MYVDLYIFILKELYFLKQKNVRVLVLKNIANLFNVWLKSRQLDFPYLFQH